jgi:CRP/FNR family transcriptional regulator, cyclic AMP receptor protein
MVRAGEDAPKEEEDGKPDLQERLEVLRNTAPFSVLEDEDLVPLAHHLRSVRYRDDETVYREGEPAGELFIVRSGQVKLTLHNPSRRKRLIGIAGPNQVFGEPGIIDHGPRAMDAQAMADCDLLAMTAGVFWMAVEAHPSLARRVIELMGERLRRSDRMAQDLIFFDAPTRLARKLLDLAEDYGESSGRTITISVRMTQGELAQMLGMSRPNVNRLLSEFESRGWLDWNEGRPVLLRPDLIVQSAG